MKLKKRTKKSRWYSEGWTLLETLIVIGIIMILTGVVGFTAIRNIEKAKLAKASSQIEAYSLALQSYYFDCNNYPDESLGLEVLWKVPDGALEPDGWDGPYINKPLADDPWGNPYIYTVPGPNNLPFLITSYGADGVEGGDGADKDITSIDVD